MTHTKAWSAGISLLVLMLLMSGCLTLLPKKPEPLDIATVTVLVSYDDGTPINDAQVSVEGLTAKLIDEGVYALNDVPYGTYELLVTVHGITHVKQVIVDSVTVSVNCEVDEKVVFHLDFADAYGKPFTARAKVSGLTVTAVEYEGTEIRLDGTNPMTGKPTIYFDNADTANRNGSFMYVADDAILDLADLPGFTIETFIRPETLKLGVLMRKTEGNIGWLVALESDGRIVFRLESTSGYQQIRTPGGAIQPKEWYHVAASWNGETMKIYVNGEERASTAYSLGLTDTSGHLGIGALLRNTALNDWGQIFHGHMGEIRISNRALLPEEFLK